MSKKSRQNPPKPREFQSVPFIKLNGMVVPDAVRAQQKMPVVEKPVEPADNNDLNLFLRMVADVKPIHKQNIKHPAQNSCAPRNAAANTKKGVSPSEECASNLFLQEISRLQLDTRFADQAPDDEEMKVLSGNRLRQVKRGIVSVKHQLDLHGLTREEALADLPRFLRSALQMEQKAVLIITGKGKHSAEEPVLQQAVGAWLRGDGRELVLEFAQAPREMGGSGAFVVFLRPVTQMISG